MKVQITTSYSRKLNHDLYGGNPYESSDFFCSITKEVEEEEKKKEIKQLYMFVKSQVDERANKEIAGLLGGMSPREFKHVLDNYIENTTLTSDQYERMSKGQQNIIQEIKKSKKRIKAKNI